MCFQICKNQIARSFSSWTLVSQEPAFFNCNGKIRLDWKVKITSPTCSTCIILCGLLDAVCTQGGSHSTSLWVESNAESKGHALLITLSPWPIEPR
jgi:hypothetical protein